MILPKPMVDDVLRSALDGGRVAVLAGRHDLARRIMQDIVDEFPELRTAAKLRWTSGDQEISFYGGGQVLFRALDRMRGANGLRGARLDRCYVPIGTSELLLEEIRPALATSSDGLLTGY